MFFGEMAVLGLALTSLSWDEQNAPMRRNLVHRKLPVCGPDLLISFLISRWRNDQPPSLQSPFLMLGPRVSCCIGTTILHRRSMMLPHVRWLLSNGVIGHSSGACALPAILGGSNQWVSAGQNLSETNQTPGDDLSYRRDPRMWTFFCAGTCKIWGIGCGYLREGISKNAGHQPLMFQNTPAIDLFILVVLLWQIWQMRRLEIEYL